MLKLITGKSGQSVPSIPDTKKDVKTEPVLVDTKLSFKHLLSKARATKGGKGKLNEVSVNLPGPVAHNTGAAATANNPVITIDPVASTEFSTWAGLYDECIVDAVTVHVAGSITGGLTSDIHGGIAFDPMDATAYGALEILLAASQKLGPFRIGGGSVLGASNNFSCSSPNAVSKTGMWVWHIKMPKGPQLYEIGSTNTTKTGSWMSTGDTTGVYGYMKAYIEAGAASVTTTLTTIPVLHMRFRSRT